MAELPDKDKRNLNVIRGYSKPNDLGVIRGESISFQPLRDKTAYTCLTCGSTIAVGRIDDSTEFLVMHMNWHDAIGS